MKTAKTKNSSARSTFLGRSVVRTNILLFIVSAAVLMLLFLLLTIAVNTIYSNTYVKNYFKLNIKDFPELLADDFETVRAGHEELDFVVFDESGNRLYATDEVMARAYTAEDAAFINEYEDNVYWSVSASTDGSEPRYYISKYRFNYDGDEDFYLGSCVLDGNYRVLSGDILQEYDQLTWEQFEMLQGNYASGELYKYEYENAGGEKRMVFYTEYDMEYTYETQIVKVQHAANFLYILFFVLAALVIVVQSLLMRRATKRYLEPLDEAITTYGKGARSSINEQELAQEFQPVAANFNALMDRLDVADAEKDKVYEERQRVIADVSHDLRTPLTVIRGYSQAFLEDRVPEDKKDQYLRVIHEKAVTSAEMIDMLFDYTKMEHPDFAPEKQIVDLTEVTEDYLTGKREELADTGNALEYVLPDHPVMHEADVRLLYRLYDNLIGNAVKHNPPGTSVYFALEERRFDIRITIADDGAGISGEIRKTLFNPFVTGNVARPSGSGTGLGMTIAKRIVDLHDGSIRLVDPPDEGRATEFEIIFHKS